MSNSPILKGPDEVKWVSSIKGTLAAHSVVCCWNTGGKIGSFLPRAAGLESPTTKGKGTGEGKTKSGHGWVKGWNGMVMWWGRVDQVCLL